MRRPAAPLALALLVACVGPARSFAVYEHKAVRAVEQSLSGVQTTRLAIRDAREGNATGPYLSITIEDAEEQTGTAQSTFASVQPPDGRSDQLRSEVGDLLSEANDTVERARIAVRRQAFSQLIGLDGDLTKIADRLDAFLDRHPG